MSAPPTSALPSISGTTGAGATQSGSLAGGAQGASVLPTPVPPPPPPSAAPTETLRPPPPISQTSAKLPVPPLPSANPLVPKISAPPPPPPAGAGVGAPSAPPTSSAPPAPPAVVNPPQAKAPPPSSAQTNTAMVPTATVPVSVPASTPASAGAAATAQPTPPTGGASATSQPASAAPSSSASVPTPGPAPAPVPTASATPAPVVPAPAPSQSAQPLQQQQQQPSLPPPKPMLGRQATMTPAQFLERSQQELQQPMQGQQQPQQQPQQQQPQQAQPLPAPEQQQQHHHQQPSEGMMVDNITTKYERPSVGNGFSGGAGGLEARLLPGDAAPDTLQLALRLFSRMDVRDVTLADEATFLRIASLLESFCDPELNGEAVALDALAALLSLAHPRIEPSIVAHLESRASATLETPHLDPVIRNRLAAFGVFTRLASRASPRFPAYFAGLVDGLMAMTAAGDGPVGQALRLDPGAFVALQATLFGLSERWMSVPPEATRTLPLPVPEGILDAADKIVQERTPLDGHFLEASLLMTASRLSKLYEEGGYRAQSGGSDGRPVLYYVYPGGSGGGGGGESTAKGLGAAAGGLAAATFVSSASASASASGTGLAKSSQHLAGGGSVNAPPLASHWVPSPTQVECYGYLSQVDRTLRTLDTRVLPYVGALRSTLPIFTPTSASTTGGAFLGGTRRVPHKRVPAAIVFGAGRAAGLEGGKKDPFLAAVLLGMIATSMRRPVNCQPFIKGGSVEVAVAALGAAPYCPRTAECVGEVLCHTACCPGERRLVMGAGGASAAVVLALCWGGYTSTAQGSPCGERGWAPVGADGSPLYDPSSIAVVPSKSQWAAARNAKELRILTWAVQALGHLAEGASGGKGSGGEIERRRRKVGVADAALAAGDAEVHAAGEGVVVSGSGGGAFLVGGQPQSSFQHHQTQHRMAVLSGTHSTAGGNGVVMLDRAAAQAANTATQAAVGGGGGEGGDDSQRTPGRGLRWKDESGLGTLETPATPFGNRVDYWAASGGDVRPFSTNATTTTTPSGWTDLGVSSMGNTLRGKELTDTIGGSRALQSQFDASSSSSSSGSGSELDGSYDPPTTPSGALISPSYTMASLTEVGVVGALAVAIRTCLEYTLVGASQEQALTVRPGAPLHHCLKALCAITRRSAEGCGAAAVLVPPPHPTFLPTPPTSHPTSPLIALLLALEAATLPPPSHSWDPVAASLALQTLAHIFRGEPRAAPMCLGVGLAGILGRVLARCGKLGCGGGGEATTQAAASTFALACALVVDMCCGRPYAGVGVEEGSRGGVSATATAAAASAPLLRVFSEAVAWGVTRGERERENELTPGEAVLLKALARGDGPRDMQGVSLFLFRAHGVIPALTEALERTTSIGGGVMKGGWGGAGTGPTTSVSVSATIAVAQAALKTVGALLVSPHSHSGGGMEDDEEEDLTDLFTSPSEQVARGGKGSKPLLSLPTLRDWILSSTPKGSTTFAGLVMEAQGRGGGNGGGGNGGNGGDLFPSFYTPQLQYQGQYHPELAPGDSYSGYALQAASMGLRALPGEFLPSAGRGDGEVEALSEAAAALEGYTRAELGGALSARLCAGVVRCLRGGVGRGVGGGIREAALDVISALLGIHPPPPWPGALKSNTFTAGGGGGGGGEEEGGVQAGVGGGGSSSSPSFMGGSGGWGARAQLDGQRLRAGLYTLAHIGAFSTLLHSAVGVAGHGSTHGGVEGSLSESLRVEMELSLSPSTFTQVSSRARARRQGVNRGLIFACRATRVILIACQACFEVGAGVAETGGAISVGASSTPSSPARSETLPLLSRILWDWGVMCELWDAMDASLAWMLVGNGSGGGGGGESGGFNTTTLARTLVETAAPLLSIYFSVAAAAVGMSGGGEGGSSGGSSSSRSATTPPMASLLPTFARRVVKSVSAALSGGGGGEGGGSSNTSSTTSDGTHSLALPPSTTAALLLLPTALLAAFPPSPMPLPYSPPQHSQGSHHQQQQQQQQQQSHTPHFQLFPSAARELGNANGVAILGGILTASAAAAGSIVNTSLATWTSTGVGGIAMGVGSGPGSGGGGALSPQGAAKAIMTLGVAVQRAATSLSFLPPSSSFSSNAAASNAAASNSPTAYLLVAASSLSATGRVAESFPHLRIRRGASPWVEVEGVVEGGLKAAMASASILATGNSGAKHFSQVLRPGQVPPDTSGGGGGGLSTSVSERAAAFESSGSGGAYRSMAGPFHGSGGVLSEEERQNTPTPQGTHPYLSPSSLSSLYLHLHQPLSSRTLLLLRCGCFLSPQYLGALSTTAPLSYSRSWGGKGSSGSGGGSGGKEGMGGGSFFTYLHRTPLLQPPFLPPPLTALATLASPLLPPFAGIPMLWIVGGEKPPPLSPSLGGPPSKALLPLPILLRANPRGRRGGLSLEAVLDVAWTPPNSIGAPRLTPGYVLWDIDVETLGGVHDGAPWEGGKPMVPMVEALADEIEVFNTAFPGWASSSSSSTGAGGGGEEGGGNAAGDHHQQPPPTSGLPGYPLLRCEEKAAGKVLCLDDYSGTSQRVLALRAEEDAHQEHNHTTLARDLPAILRTLQALLAIAW